MRRVLVPAIALGVLLSAGLARAEGPFPSWQGQWKIASTEHPPSFPKIENHILTVTKDDGSKLAYTDHWTIGGKPSSSSYDGAYDGKPYKTSDGQNMAYEHVAGGYQDHWTNDSGASGEDRCTFTSDGLHMNCASSMTPKGGQPVAFKEHWDKVQ